MSPSKIEWTEETWNPTTGCTKVSTGCDHCYAERMATRLAGRFGYPADEPFRLTLHEDRIDEPLQWRRPRLVFVNSMSDLFHPDVPDEFILGVLSVVDRTPRHTYQVLTKRPQRLARFMQVHDALVRRVTSEEERPNWPLRNLWLGTSIENDRYTWRADHLRETPAAMRFLSCEPLLGPLPSLELTGIDWLIAGGESGPGARPCHPKWVRDLRDRCTEAGVCFFFKQWGAWAPQVEARLPTRSGECLIASQLFLRVGKAAAGRELDGRTWDEMPKRAA